MNKLEKLDHFLLSEGNIYDPFDKEQRERFLQYLKVKIGSDEQDGWTILWEYGGGQICPPMEEDDARSIIALFCYLTLIGVDVHLRSTLAYWHIRGPKLGKINETRK